MKKPAFAAAAFGAALACAPSHYALAAALDGVADSLKATLAPVTKMTFAGATTDEATRAVVLSGVAFESGDERITVGRLVLLGVEPGAGAGGAALPAVERVRLEDIAVSDKSKGTARIAVLDVAAPKLPVRLLDLMLGAKGPKPDGAEALDLAKDVRIGALYVEGVRSDGAGAAKGETTELGAFRIDGVRDGRMERLQLSGLQVDAEGNHVSVDSLRLDGLNFGAIGDRAVELAAMRVASRGAKDAKDPKAKEALLKEKEGLVEALFHPLDPGLDSLVLNGLKISKGARGPVSLRSFALDGVERRDGLVTASTVRLDGLAIPAAAMDDPKAEQALAALGYQGIDLSMSFGSRMDLDAKTMTAGPMEISAAGMASVKATISFGNFDYKQILQQVVGAAKSKQPPIPLFTVTGLDLEVRDASLIARLLDQAAAPLKGGRTELVQNAEAMIDGLAAQANAKGPRVDALRAAVGSFLRKPGTLTLSAHPQQPVPVLEAGLGLISSPEATLQRLDVRVDAR